MSTLMIGIESLVDTEYPELEGNDRRELIDKMVKEKVQETTEFLVDAFNSMGNEELVRKAMLEGITRSHRCIQQEFWTGMFKNIEEYGNSEEFDSRNIWAIRYCKQMADALK